MTLYRDQLDISSLTKNLFRIGFDMLFSELHNFMVDNVTFVVLRGKLLPLDSPLYLTASKTKV